MKGSVARPGFAFLYGVTSRVTLSRESVFGFGTLLHPHEPVVGNSRAHEYSLLSLPPITPVMLSRFRRADSDISGNQLKVLPEDCFTGGSRLRVL